MIAGLVFFYFLGFLPATAIVETMFEYKLSNIEKVGSVIAWPILFVFLCGWATFNLRSIFKKMVDDG